MQEVIEANSRLVLPPERKEADVAPAEAPKLEPKPVIKEEPATFKTIEVECLVEKDDSLGLDVSATTVNHLVIKRLQLGAISIYNSKQASGQTKVQPFDRIIAVNGEASTAETLATKLNYSSGAVKLKLEKPNVLGVMIRKDDQKLGLDVEPKSDIGVVVAGIQAGCIVGYNEGAPPSRQVKVDDIIIGQFLKDAEGKIQVEKSKSPEELMKYLQQDGPIGLTVLSYS
eukprot:TRINITY_DN101048_c0_g1_i1.p1 TRINITY_DN101048_c0_g1~~TRINITY_DN101048_c0_g1_i1.p1  ORF type:complete len:253 (+),score=64.99 TRINITY_DN101048_c0_g1_i1:78-761(+)